MPRSSFSSGMLSAATPGLSRLAQAIGGAGQVGQDAYDRELTLQSRLAQTMAQIKAQEAAARAHDADAAQKAVETSILQGRPDTIDESVALSTGSTLPMVRAVQEFTRTGIRPMKPAMGPETEDGSQAAQFPVVDDPTHSKIAQALARTLTLRTNLKDTKADDWANAQKIYREGDLSDAIISGRADRNTVGGAQAAAGAKELYKVNSDGGVLDLYGGKLDTSNPLAAANITLLGEKGKSEKALQADRYASAGQHSASAAKTRQETAQGAKGVLQQTDQGLVLVDPRAGTATPVMGPNGQPLTKPVNLKEIPATVNTKMIEARQGLSNLDAAIKAVEANPGAFGLENAIPGMQSLKGASPRWADQNAIDARAQVANIGSLKLHDRSGAAVSASEFPRLQPFIPSASDSAETAATKLRQMKRIAEEELGLYTDTYSAENGYRVPERRKAPSSGGFTYLGKE